MSQRVLVTGFEPFGGDAANPSSELALSVDGLMFGAIHVVGRVLPVEYLRSSQLLLEWMAELRPVAIICAGLAATADFMHALQEKGRVLPAGFIHIPQDMPRSAEIIPIMLGALT